MSWADWFEYYLKFGIDTFNFISYMHELGSNYKLNYIFKFGSYLFG